MRLTYRCLCICGIPVRFITRKCKLKIQIWCTGNSHALEAKRSKVKASQSTGLKCAMMFNLVETYCPYEMPHVITC